MAYVPGLPWYQVAVTLPAASTARTGVCALPAALGLSTWTGALQLPLL
jgi:hypothetical protein